MYPIIVCESPINQLLDALHKVTGAPFTRVPVQQKSVDSRNRLPLLAGEHQDLCYLVDVSHTLLPSSWECLLKISEDLSCLIVSASHDPMESQCEFFASKHGKLLRLFWHNAERTARDYSVGNPLDSEAAAPLSTQDGSGLNAALQSIGFDQMNFTKGFERTPGDYYVTWPSDGLAIHQEDKLTQELNAHIRKYENSSHQPPTPRIRIRQQDE